MTCPAVLPRRTVLGGGLALLAALAACGTGDDAPDAGPADDGYPRTVTDATDVDVEVPARPERVVAAQNLWDLDALLALGVAPVQLGLRDFAEYTGSATTSWPWHERALERLGGDVQRLSVGEAPDVEAIAGARPDLVVGDDFLGEARDELAALAPVLQVASFDWRRNLRVVGEALDLAPEAEQLITDTDARLDDALSGYAVDGARVAVFAVYDTTAFYVFADPSIPTVDLFQRAGFGQVDEMVAGATPEEARLEYSIEELGRLAAADALVVVDYSAGDAAAGLAQLELYARLPAVEAGRVVVVPQGERAQGLSTLGPLTVDIGLDLVREVADLLG